MRHFLIIVERLGGGNRWKSLDCVVKTDHGLWELQDYSGGTGKKGQPRHDSWGTVSFTISNITISRCKEIVVSVDVSEYELLLFPFNMKWDSLIFEQSAMSSAQVHCVWCLASVVHLHSLQLFTVNILYRSLFNHMGLLSQYLPWREKQADIPYSVCFFNKTYMWCSQSRQSHSLLSLLK